MLLLQTFNYDLLNIEDRARQRMCFVSGPVIGQPMVQTLLDVGKACLGQLIGQATTLACVHTPGEEMSREGG